MEILLLILVGFGASWLTFYCGFGLGTLLTPVFLLLFKDPIVAMACTAIVHFLNNVFKFLMMKREVDWKIALPFALAAIPAAFLGAYLSTFITTVELTEYSFMGKTFEIDLFNLVFGIILIIFALIEIVPSWSIAFSKQKLWMGGLISGFFGGLSGHQGALRSAFLIKYQLKKEVFIATGIIVALAVDLVRTPIYLSQFNFEQLGDGWIYILVALSAALLGAISGKMFLKKMKMKLINWLVSTAMILFGVALILGFI